MIARGTCALPYLLAWATPSWASWHPWWVFAYAKAPHKSAGLVAAWNVLGLLDLTDALGLGCLTAPSRFALEIQPTSDLMTVLPLVLVPVYLVPLFFVLHLASLAKLYREVIASNGHGRGVHARA